MDCKIFSEEKINKYIDDELNTEQQMKFKKHIAGCDYCKNYLSELKSVISILKKTDKINIPQRVWYKIKDKFVKKRMYSFIGQVGFAGVCLGVILVVAFNLRLYNKRIQEVSTHVAEQIEYLHNIDIWYLDDENGESVVDLFLLGEL